MVPAFFNVSFDILVSWIYPEHHFQHSSEQGVKAASKLESSFQNTCCLSVGTITEATGIPLVP